MTRYTNPLIIIIIIIIITNVLSFYHDLTQPCITSVML